MGVNKRLGVVAWLAVTVLSVAASTAAVASVREQVTDRPDLVSLAVLRRAAETDTTSPQTVALPQEIRQDGAATTPDTIAPAVAETTTTRPAVEAVPDTIVETTTTTTTPPATTTTTEDDRDGGRGFGRGDQDDDSNRESRDFEGGSVSVAWDGDQLHLVEASPDDGYEYEVEKQSDREIVLRFSTERRRSTTVVASIDRGRVEIRVFD